MENTCFGKLNIKTTNCFAGAQITNQHQPGENKRFKAFRRNIYFPELLFDPGLTGHRDERFLIKIESQDLQIKYERKMVSIKGCGFIFLFRNHQMKYCVR